MIFGGTQRKHYLALCLYGLLFLTARGDEVEEIQVMMSARSARGRIEVYAFEAEPLQKLSFWAERSLKQLEKDWGVGIPFQSGQSFQLVIDPAAEQVTLLQHWQGSVLLQKLVLSEAAMSDHPVELARAFTRAMALRAALAAMPPERKNRQWEVPAWLVHGSAHALLSGRSRALFEGLVLAYPEAAPPSPEVVTQFDFGDRIREEAAAALLCRWAFDKNAPRAWQEISQADFRDSEVWIRMLPKVGNVRELHQYWDLWWMAERGQLTADYGIEAAALQALEGLHRFVPAFYGLEMEEEDRYAELGFAGLEAYLDDPRFGLALQEWVLRLQRLRFRQSEEFNQRVEQWQQAGRLAIQASVARGRKRQRLWTQAVEIMREVGGW